MLNSSEAYPFPSPPFISSTIQKRSSRSQSITGPGGRLLSRASGQSDVPTLDTNPSITQQDDTKKLLVLGVCGGIASGKSKACQILNTANDTEGVCLFEGASIVGHVDVDKLAHTVYEPGSPIMQEITNIFGQGVLASDQSLDRAALGSIVFSDRSKMSVRTIAIDWRKPFCYLKAKDFSLCRRWNPLYGHTSNKNYYKN